MKRKRERKRKKATEIPRDFRRGGTESRTAWRENSPPPPPFGEGRRLSTGEGGPSGGKRGAGSARRARACNFSAAVRIRARVSVARRWQRKNARVAAADDEREGPGTLGHSWCVRELSRVRPRPPGQVPKVERKRRERSVCVAYVKIKCVRRARRRSARELGWISHTGERKRERHGGGG